MSVDVNTNLLEEAQFYLDYFGGTIMEKLIAQDIQDGDLESLAEHLRQARNTAFDLEFNPHEDHQAQPHG